MRAIGYILTNQEESDREANQYELQFDSITYYCKQNDHNLIKVFSDSSSSGRNPGYRDLIDFIASPNQASMVVVTGADILGTSLEEAVSAILQIDHTGSTAVCSSADYPDAIQNALRVFQKERSEQIRGAMIQKASQGKALGRPAYGYQIDEDHNLTPNLNEAPIVSRIFTMYVHEGLGLRRIAERLNSSYDLARNDKQWTIAQILAILRNPVYIGTYRRFGLRMPHNHEAIISTQDFTSTQQLMRSKRTYKSKRQQQIYPLSGLLACEHCTGKMIGFSRKQNWRRKDGTRNQKIYRYYYCPNRLNNPLCKSNVTSATQWEQGTSTSLYHYFLKHPKERTSFSRWKEPNTGSTPTAPGGPISFDPNLKRRWMRALRLTATGSLTLGDLRRITSDLEYLNSGANESESITLSRIMETADFELWQSISLREQKVLFTSFIDTAVEDSNGVAIKLLNGEHYPISL